MSASTAMRAKRSSQFLIRIRFLDRFCRSRTSRRAGKMTCLGVCRMNRWRITGNAASPAPAASPACIKENSMRLTSCLAAQEIGHQRLVEGHPRVQRNIVGPGPDAVGLVPCPEARDFLEVVGLDGVGVDLEDLRGLVILE